MSTLFLSDQKVKASQDTCIHDTDQGSEDDGDDSDNDGLLDQGRTVGPDDLMEFRLNALKEAFGPAVILPDSFFSSLLP